MVSMKQVALSALSALGLAQAGSLQLHDSSFTPDYILRVTLDYASLACRYRLSTLINGTAPGPPIYMRENQTTWVRVYNDMQADNLTIHWHGLSQSVAPFSDGTPQASQWPIPPNHFFDYEVHPGIGQAGSYYYHSHVLFQAVSAAGALIVEEASGSPPYSYDGDNIFTLTELFNKTDQQVVDGATATLKDFVFSGEAESVLVNGFGYPADSAEHAETTPPVSHPPNNTVPSCKPAVFEVEPGKTYRFRSIGALALSLVSFVFENHDELTVIEVDGAYTKPAKTNRIQIGPGQRFDFLLKTKSEEELKKAGKQNFWIQLETRYRPVNTTSYAVLAYKNSSGTTSPAPSSAPTPAPLTITNDIQDWLEYTLEPLQSNDFPPASEVTRTVYLRNEQISYQSGVYWSTNNRTWTEIDEHIGDVPVSVRSNDVGVPYLVNIYKEGQKAIPNFEDAVTKHDGYSPEKNVYVAEKGEVIDVVLYNLPNDAYGGFDIHPWHIHGGHVYDLGSGNGTYDAAANEKKLQGYNPVLRDTTYLYKYVPGYGIDKLPAFSNQGWRAWRLKVQDTGVWMVHCHILIHMVMGLQTVWVMGNASDITSKTEPYVSGYLDYGGSAYGNASYDPFVLHYFED